MEDIRLRWSISRSMGEEVEDSRRSQSSTRARVRTSV